MDLCISYLNDARQCINRINELPIYEAVFTEAEELEKINEENSEASEKSISLLRKALNVVKGIYNTIKQIIKDFIDYIKLSSSEKDQFKQFEEECKNNPEFANKKITVKNWKAIEDAYDKAIGIAESEIKDMTRRKDEARPNVLNYFKTAAEKAAGIAKDAAVEVTVQKALSMAKESPKLARQLYEEMDKENSITRQIEAQLGEKQYKKTKRELKHLSSKIHLVRLLAGARKAKAKEETENGKNILSQIWTVYRSVKHVTKRNDDAKAVYKGLKSTAFDTGKEVVKQRFKTKREERRYEKEIKQMKKELGKE